MLAAVVACGVEGLPAVLGQLRDCHDRTGVGLIPSTTTAPVRRGTGLRHRPPAAHLGLGAGRRLDTTEAVAAITRITNGNFRLTTRLVDQIERVTMVTKEVVEAARGNLVIAIT